MQLKLADAAPLPLVEACCHLFSSDGSSCDVVASRRGLVVISSPLMADVVASRRSVVISSL